MDNIMSLISGASWLLWLIPLLVVLLLWKQVLKLFGIYIIPDDSIGIVNKKFVLFAKHKTLPDGRIVALQGEAGLQADTLAPGLHFFLWPWQFEVKITKFTVIPTGHVGIVEAKDGVPIPAGRVLAASVDCDYYQDARKFMQNNGERGPQVGIVPPGVYRINTALFAVKIEKAFQVPDEQVGIVTTFEGTPLEAGEIAGQLVAGHNVFQDGDAFVKAGGKKGLQEQVMLAGTYYLNPLFCSVDLEPMTEVPIGNVGVVVAYVGDAAQGGGQQFAHGTIVERGQKGVWREPLDPGKYPINRRTHLVELVPTTNIVLNWATGKTASHELDQHLSTITVRSSDGFTFNLDVSQIIHVSRAKASAVIARFGNMSNLVKQVLEPLIGNYFRNSAQSSDAIEFLQKRAERQQDAKTHIKTALEADYDVQAVDTLIGDISPPPELMETLTQRKIAERMKETYTVQMEAQVTRQDLERATAEADTRAQVVQASRSVEVARLGADAKLEDARGEAGAKEINAKADAMVLETVGAAQAKNTEAVGGAEASVLRQKVEAVGSSAYATMAVAESLRQAGVPLVPEVNVAGGGEEGGGTLVQALLGTMLAGKLGEGAGGTSAAPAQPAKPAAAPKPAARAPRTPTTPAPTDTPSADKAE